MHGRRAARTRLAHRRQGSHSHAVTLHQTPPIIYWPSLSHSIRRSHTTRHETSCALLHAAAIRTFAFACPPTGERAAGARGGGDRSGSGGGGGRAAAARRTHVAFGPEAVGGAGAPDANAAKGGARDRSRVRRAARHLRRACGRHARPLAVHRRTRFAALHCTALHTARATFLVVVYDDAAAAADADDDDDDDDNEDDANDNDNDIYVFLQSGHRVRC